ncbi:hypothetical protein OTB20_38910 [Streptomyces sp. H27-H1]|uniref:hypothetical protein n=1 Tax=Streptomyces sp. H27-H1 TaxID=2996461 RepID=UPI00226D55FF|nr:hypothetical protein [Streptomyces sp. H27-H1]MCY0932041.1 hypothetical protein [Streptomyces sp. H27-H1]
MPRDDRLARLGACPASPARTRTDRGRARQRWWHYASFTVDGKRIGPLRIRGPELEEVFDDLARPKETGALFQAAHRNTGARTLAARTKTALAQEQRVRTFLAQRTAASTRAHTADDSKDQYR